MSVEEEGITLTIKARDLSELREKLMAHLAELGVKVSEEAEEPEEVEIDFPEEIKRIYPDYEYNYHSAAMLTVLHEKHKGKEKMVSSRDLAKEMKERFPEYFRRVPIKKISWGNIFAGTQLEERGLIHIERDKDRRRFYWVE